LPRFALEIRETIHERVNAPQMWDAPGYFQSLANLGFELQVEDDWSDNVAPIYALGGNVRMSRFEGNVPHSL